MQQRVREDLRNGGSGKIDPNTIPPDPLLQKIDYPPLDQPQSEQHRRDIESIEQKQAQDESANNPPSTVEGYSPPVIERFPFTTTPLRVIHAQSNTKPTLPKITDDGEPSPDSNAVQINPDGPVYLVTVAQIQRPEEQMCVRQ